MFHVRQEEASAVGQRGVAHEYLCCRTITGTKKSLIEGLESGGGGAEGGGGWGGQHGRWSTEGARRRGDERLEGATLICRKSFAKHLSGGLQPLDELTGERGSMAS